MNQTVWKSICSDDELNYDVHVRWNGTVFSVWLQEEGIGNLEPLSDSHAAHVRDGIQYLLEQKLGSYVAENLLASPQQVWMETKEALQLKLPQRVVDCFTITVTGIRYEITLSTDGFVLFFAARKEGQSRKLSPKQIHADVQAKLALKYSFLGTSLAHTHQIPIHSGLQTELDIALPQIGAYMQAIEQIKQQGFAIVPEHSGIAFSDVLQQLGIQADTFRLEGVWYASQDREGLLACHDELNKRKQRIKQEEQELKQQLDRLRQQQMDVMDAQFHIQQSLSDV